ncbi:MAG: glycoside hydrolase family 30 beta sandwich domain-containing protein, partial [Pyrinomonadaceae bacterium]
MALRTGAINMAVGLLFLAVVNCGQATPQQTVITLDPQQKFQMISGWEATAQAAESYSPAFANYKERLFQEAVNDLGINRLRLEIRSGAENPQDFFRAFEAGQINEEAWRSHYYEVMNDNDDPFTINPKGFTFSELDSTVEKIILPMRKLLSVRGESLFVNLNYIDFADWRGASNISHKSDPEEYAEFILAAYEHLQSKYGFVPDAVEVILEPDAKTGWTGTDIGRVMVATAKRLRANNFAPAFIVPSTTNAANAPIYIDEIAQVPDAMQYVKEFSYHRYCCVSPDVLKRIAERASKFGVGTGMLEWIGADQNTLHEDLKVGNNSSWQQYTLAFNNQPDNGAQYYLVDDKEKLRPTVTGGRRTAFLRQYFRYIRRGAVRIGAGSSNSSFDPVAFINANGNYVVVVKAVTPGTISFETLPPGKYGKSYTTADRSAT